MTNQYLEDFAAGQIYRSNRLQVDKGQIFGLSCCNLIRSLTTLTRRQPANWFLKGLWQVDYIQARG